MFSDNDQKVPAKQIPAQPNNDVMKLNYDLLISGAGPTGLYTALLSILEGLSVVLVNDRVITGRETPVLLGNFTRPQGVFIDETHKHKFIEMCLKLKRPFSLADKKFFQALLGNATIAIRQVQSFLLRRLEEAAKDRRCLLTILSPYEIKSIDMYTGKVIVEASKYASKALSKALPKVEVTCTRMLGSDGVQHHAATVFNEDKRCPPFTYSSVVGPGKKEHVTIRASVKLANPPKNNLNFMQFQAVTVTTGGMTPMSSPVSSITPVSSTPRLSSLLSRLPMTPKVALTPAGSPVSTPKVALTPVGSSTPKKGKKESYSVALTLNRKLRDQECEYKCGFAGEIPKDLYEKLTKYGAESKNNPQPFSPELETEVQNFVRLSVATALQCDPNAIQVSLPLGQKEFESIEQQEASAIRDRRQEKRKLSVKTFTNERMAANKAYCKIITETGAIIYFVLGGDAFLSPNYQLGHGLNDGLTHARWLVLVFTNKMTCEVYEEKCKQLASARKWATRILNWSDLLPGKAHGQVYVMNLNQKSIESQECYKYLKNLETASIVYRLVEEIEEFIKNYKDGSEMHALTQAMLLHGIKNLPEQSPGDLMMLIMNYVELANKDMSVTPGKDTKFFDFKASLLMNYIPELDEIMKQAALEESKQKQEEQKQEEQKQEQLVTFEPARVSPSSRTVSLSPLEIPPDMDDDKVSESEWYDDSVEEKGPSLAYLRGEDTSVQVALIALKNHVEVLNAHCESVDRSSITFPNSPFRTDLELYRYMHGIINDYINPDHNRKASIQEVIMMERRLKELQLEVNDEREAAKAVKKVLELVDTFIGAADANKLTAEVLTLMVRKMDRNVSDILPCLYSIKGQRQTLFVKPQAPSSSSPAVQPVDEKQEQQNGAVTNPQSGSSSSMTP